MRIDFDNKILGAQSPEVRQSTLPFVSEATLATHTDEAPILRFRGRFWRPPQGTLGLIHVPLQEQLLKKMNLIFLSQKAFV